jgi:hypothetical protein
MIRVLVVLNNADDPNLPRLAAGLEGIHVSGCLPHVSQLEIERLDPHCILSIGPANDFSSLWSLPLWIRQTWLHIPDFKVAPLAIKQSLLSLINSAIDSPAFPSQSVISVWGKKLKEQKHLDSFINHGYDNWQFLEDKEDSLEPLVPRMLCALANARNGWLWIYNSEIASISHETLKGIVDICTGAELQGSMIVAEHSDREKLLDNLTSNEQPAIRHIVIHRESFFSGNTNPYSLPVKGLMGVVAKLLCTSSTHITSEVPGVTFNRPMLVDMDDAVDVTMSHGPVQWAKWVLAGLQVSHFESQFENQHVPKLEKL